MIQQFFNMAFTLLMSKIMLNDIPHAITGTKLPPVEPVEENGGEGELYAEITPKGADLLEFLGGAYRREYPEYLPDVYADIHIDASRAGLITVQNGQIVPTDEGMAAIFILSDLENQKNKGDDEVRVIDLRVRVAFESTTEVGRVIDVRKVIDLLDSVLVVLRDINAIRLWRE